MIRRKVLNMKNGKKNRKTSRIIKVIQPKEANEKGSGVSGTCHCN